MVAWDGRLGALDVNTPRAGAFGEVRVVVQPATTSGCRALPLRLSPGEWRRLLRWFVLGQSAEVIAQEARLERKRVLRALIVVRQAMVRDVPHVFSGVVEVDETYLGGSWRNRRLAKRVQGTKRGRGTTKQAVFGILCRGGPWFGNGSNLSSWRKTRPKPGAASALTHVLTSSSGCAAGGNRQRACDSTIHRTWWVGTQGRLAPNVGSPGGGVRRVGWRGNGVGQNGAMGKARFGGPDWAQPYGPWQGWYQAQSVDGEGEPLEHCGCGSCHPSCWRRPWTPSARTTTAHRGGTPTPVSADKGYDNPSGRGAAAGHGYTHRRGEAGRLWRAVSGAPVGCGTDAGMALQVPCGPGPVRQEGSELPGCVTAGMCAPVVPAQWQAILR